MPEWHRFSERLERIVLASHSEDLDGYYMFYDREETGAVFLHAWPDDLWREIAKPYFNTHQDLFEKLGVSYDRKEDRVTCRFTKEQARAFMLLHVFMHELGHHYDRSQQKHFGSSKGEDHAETFATSRFEQLFLSYVRVFGHPNKTV